MAWGARDEPQREARPVTVQRAPAVQGRPPRRLGATNFPGDQNRFAKTFPVVRLQPRVVFVHDGKAVTSVGETRSCDLAVARGAFTPRARGPTP